MDLESTMLSTRLQSSTQIIDKNICYMQQVVTRDKRSTGPVNNGAFFRCCSILVCSYE